MTVFAVVLVNVVGLAVVTAGLVWSGERSQVLVYAIIFDCSLSLLTIHAITRVLREKPAGPLARLLPWVSSRPAPGQWSYPLTEAESKRPVGPGGYLLVMALLAFLAFVLGNVNADHELDLDVPTFFRDVGWSIGLALTYWIQGIASRSLVIDPAASRAANFGYNTRELTVLAFATLTAGMVVVARQMMDLPASGWAMLAPVLAFRFLYDLSGGIQLARRRSDDRSH